MIIIGCDYHPGFQQMAFVNTDTGELEERRLQHREEAEKFYRDLAAQLLTPLVQHKEKGPARCLLRPHLRPPWKYVLAMRANRPAQLEEWLGRPIGRLLDHERE